MAQPHPQTGAGNTPGATVQPPVAQRQAAGGPPPVNTPLTSALNRTVDRPASAVPAPNIAGMSNPQSAPEKPAAEKNGNEAGANSDWGVAPEKTGMSRENKFILFVLVVLVAVFSYVVFRNFQKRGAKDEVAKQEVQNPDQAKKPDAKKTDGDVPPPAGKSGQKHAHSGKHHSDGGKTDELKEPADNEEPAQLSSNMFDEQDEAAKPTTPRATTRRVSSQSSASDAIEEDVAAHPKVEEEEVAKVPEQPTESNEFEPVARRTNRRTAVEPPAQEENEVPVTMAAPRGRVQVEPTEDIEGSAEPMEPATRARAPMGPRGMDSSFAAEPMEVDESVEQAAGTTMKEIPAARGPRQPMEVGGEEVAQGTAPMLPDDTDLTSTPAVPPAHRTGGRTGARNHQHGESGQHGGTASRTHQHRTAVPPPANEDKYGGMQPVDVNSRSPAPRGNFDPQTDPLVSNTGEYVIHPNDNYWRISRKVYGTARYFEALRKHNEQVIPDPKNMKVGTRIATPSADLLEQQYKKLLPVMAAPKPAGAAYTSPNAPKTPGYFLEPGNQPAYRVGPTDTLSTIAQRTLGRSTRWDEIYEMNRDRLTGHDSLAVGTILRLPPDASQPRVAAGVDERY